MNWKNIIKYLPVGSFIHYFRNDLKKDWNNISVLKRRLTGHFLYAACTLVALSTYSNIVISTSEWNPVKQTSVIVQRVKQGRIELQKYKTLENKIFGEKGYADKDGNGLSVEETIEAFEKMGLKDKISVHRLGNGNFQISYPTPTLKDLEKAVKSYEAELKNTNTQGYRLESRQRLEPGIYGLEGNKIAEAPGHEKHTRQMAEPGIIDLENGKFAFEPGIYKEVDGIWKRVGEPAKYKPEGEYRGIPRNLEPEELFNFLDSKQTKEGK